MVTRIAGPLPILATTSLRLRIELPTHSKRSSCWKERLNVHQLRIRWFLIVVIVKGCLMLVDPRLSEAQIRPINQEEAKVPAYDVPDCLVQANGKRVAAIGDWDAHRRYLIATLANQEYGLAPSDTVKLEVTELERGKTPSQQSERRQLRMRLSRNDQAVDVDVVVYLPPKIDKPVPCFLALNFRGNHAMSDDPAVRLPSSWLPDVDGVVEHRATEAGRNLAAHRWPIDLITSRGYGLISAYYGDLDPDIDDQFQNGVHALFPEWKSDDAHPHRWGSIAAWAWGLSRMADGLVEQPGVDLNGLMVVGHSRLGKTALWAGVNDPRFQIAFSNNSGCGGARVKQADFWGIDRENQHLLPALVLP